MFDPSHDSPDADVHDFTEHCQVKVHDAWGSFAGHPSIVAHDIKLVVLSIGYVRLFAAPVINATFPSSLLYFTTLEIILTIEPNPNLGGF
jgi:hypothetical protein